MTAELAPALLATTDPAAYIEQATDIAQRLARIVEDRGLYTEFPDRRGGVNRHVNVEGWALLAAMCRVYVDIESSDYDPAADAWVARARPHVMGGEAWGAVDAMCSRAEPNWRGRPDYALRSMAQTRAIAKSLRVSPIGGIVALAGFDATPAEEMAPEPEPSAPPTPTRRRRVPAGSVERDQLRRAVYDAARVRGMGAGAIADLAAEAGVEGGEATADQLVTMLRRIEERPVLADPAADEVEAHGEGGYA